jgi:N-glycosylase/DNA lyase
VNDMTHGSDGRWGGQSDERAGRITAPDLDLALTLECGQVFGWHKEEGSYIGIIEGSPVELRQAGDRVEFRAPRALGRARVAHYLGLDDDLKAILTSVSVDPFMRRVLRAVRGLRLVKQEPWHCLCSYLLSSSNRVERIDKTVKEIARRWGDAHCLGGREVHSLPEPEALAGCGEPGIRACGAGFRAPYLARAAARVADGTIDFDQLGLLPYEEAKQILVTIDGVGEKIADCVLLFAFSKYEAFPVDVWIKKAIEQIYFDGRTVNNKEIRRFAREHFGPYAGYAQEYIYYYARVHGL